MADYSIDEMRQIVQPIAAKYGVERIFLFGSRAKGSNTLNSDIDFRLDKGAVTGAFTLCRLYSELSEAFQAKVDLLTTGSLDESFLREIKEDEVLIYDRQGL